MATAWRSYDQRDASRWLQVRVVPLISEADAASYVHKLPDLLVFDPRANSVPSEMRVIEGLAVPGLDLASGREVSSIDKRGPGTAWSVTGHVGPVALIAQCACYNDAWTLDAASSVFAHQAAKIRSVVDQVSRSE
jgi:hypothetical protein